MKQYRITSRDITPDSNDDCFLAPEDPIHGLKAASALGGLGGQVRLTEYTATLPKLIVGSNKGQLQREQGIKPGTEEWFSLWFDKNK